MKKTRHFQLLLAAGLLALGQAGAQKPMTVADLAAWQRITQQAITDDGKWVAYKMEPWQGDATVYLHTADGTGQATYSPAKDFRFSASGDYLLVTETTPLATMDSLRLAKTKEDALPMDRLLIRHTDGQEERIDSLKQYKLADKADWLAYQSGRKDSTLVVRSLDGKRDYRFARVSDYAFAEKSATLYFVTKGNGTDLEAGIYLLDPTKGTPSLVKAGDGLFRQVALDEQGNQLAFLYCAEKDSAYKALELWLSERGETAKAIATAHSASHVRRHASSSAPRPNHGRKTPPSSTPTARTCRSGAGTSRCNIPSSNIT